MSEPLCAYPNCPERRLRSPSLVHCDVVDAHHNHIEEGPWAHRFVSPDTTLPPPPDRIAEPSRTWEFLRDMAEKFEAFEKRVQDHHGALETDGVRLCSLESKLAEMDRRVEDCAKAEPVRDWLNGLEQQLGERIMHLERKDAGQRQKIGALVDDVHSLNRRIGDLSAGHLPAWTGANCRLETLESKLAEVGKKHNGLVDQVRAVEQWARDHEFKVAPPASVADAQGETPFVWPGTRHPRSECRYKLGCIGCDPSMTPPPPADKQPEQSGPVCAAPRCGQRQDEPNHFIGIGAGTHAFVPPAPEPPAPTTPEPRRYVNGDKIELIDKASVALLLAQAEKDRATVERVEAVIREWTSNVFLPDSRRMCQGLIEAMILAAPASANAKETK